MEQGKCLPPCQRPCSCAGIFLMPPVGRCMNISIVPMKKAMAGTNSGFHIRKKCGHDGMRRSSGQKNQGNEVKQEAAFREAGRRA